MEPTLVGEGSTNQTRQKADSAPGIIAMPSRGMIAADGLLRTTPAGNAERRSGLTAWIAAAALVVTLGAGWSVLPLSDWLDAFRGWIVGLGIAGILIFVATYAIGAVVLAPELVLTIVAGYAYGGWGLPIVLVAATIGACLAFLVARHLARDKVRQLLEHRRAFVAIDTAVAEDGWKIVLLLRLSPLIPFNLQNYLLGVTFFGILPGGALYTFVGAAGYAIEDHGGTKWAVLASGLLAAVMVVFLITRKARAKLQQAGLDGTRERPPIGSRVPN